MRIYRKQNVLEASLDRMRYLFDEFEEVIVGFSGGKDSTVILNLALTVAKERGIEKVPVLFLDQEAEWTETINLVKEIMYDPRVKPIWLQMPLRLQNATSHKNEWLNCWKEGDDWIREKDPISIKENTFGVDRFGKLFGAVIGGLYKGRKVCYVAGVRAEESPGRSMGTTQGATYKWITWGTKLGKNQYTFYPIYDWSYTDVWAYIFKNKIRYNKIYDLQYRKGLNVREMRVSNVHHETAVGSLFVLQEFDKELYEALTKRLGGIDTAGKMGDMGNFFRYNLPKMFSSWVEYRDFLFEKLLTNEEAKNCIRHYIYKYEQVFANDKKNLEISAQKVVSSIIANDIGGTKLHNYDISFVDFYKKNHNITVKKYADKNK